MKIWFKTAAHLPIRKRATRVALFVGLVLVLINHGDQLVRGDMSWVMLIKIVLTFMVPYAVSTHGSVSTILDGQKSKSEINANKR